MEMRAVYAECMAELMKADPNVCILDADLARANGTLGMYPKFPKQMFDVGIAEQNMASIGAGLASYGFKPYVQSFTAFATRRICDQVAISIAYAKQNVKVVGTDPGMYAELNGGTHMSFEDIAVLRSIPGIVIFEPVDATQLRAAMPVINDYDGCVYIRLFRKEAPDVFGEDYKFDLFKADRLREGADVSIFVSGQLTTEVLTAADKLKEEGINCDVYNIHTIKPIDREAVLASAAKTGAVLTVENHNVIGGLYSAVAEVLGTSKIPVVGLGVNDRWGEVGKVPYLREVFGFTAENIMAKAKEAIAAK